MSLIAFQSASYLTDPVCKSREVYVRLSRFETGHFEKIWLSAQLVAYVALALFATLPGLGLRILGIFLNPHSYLYQQGEGKEKATSDRFSLLSWNICCVPAGYTITDGGVVPWPQRMPRIIQTIAQLNSDVVSLYEVFDTHACRQLYEGLRPHYRHFYTHIGMRVIGAPSGIFVASKIRLTQPRFTPFPLDSLIGRTKFASKGVFSVNVGWMRLFATHLQHSEIPAQPTRAEKTARAVQMLMILREMRYTPESLLTGDLNLDSAEYRQAQWSSSFKGVVHFDPPTWGGDQFCARLMKKPVSGPCNLDYTVLFRTAWATLTTQQQTVAFDPRTYSDSALSDHNGLLSKISTV